MRLTVCCLPLLLLMSCSGKGVTDSVTPPIKPDTTPITTVQRTSLTVHVQIDPADAAIAASTGVSVAGIVVRLSRDGVNGSPRTGLTDASGTVQFDSLLDGRYTASAERTLTVAEVARLAPSDRDASVFAGGSTTPVTPPNAPSTTVSIAATRRGSLVISELFAYFGNPTPYNWGYYVEIYNNGDTTAYLDGMYLARTSISLLTDQRANCDVAEYLPFRTDTARLWVRDGLRFPGTGRQFPVPPGEARVYATDALDHRTASGSSNFADLSGAQFEDVGTDADTDSPTAANMIKVFGTTVGGAGGRGARLGGLQALVLVKPTAESRITQATLNPYNVQNGAGVPFTPQLHWGIPRDEIIDVFSTDYSPDYKAYLASTTFRYTLCQPFLPSVFERSPAEVFDDTFRPGAVRRRSIGRTSDGREILMRTHTSARDIEVTTNLLQRSLNKGR